MEHNFDTICAIITPMALGAVGIVRISGDKAFQIAQKMFTKDIKPKMINYGFIVDEDGKKIDEVILLPFVAPCSYTAEDVIEIQSHGSMVILNSIMELCMKYGARIAQRGEFTKRAFLNNRIDLSQAEAVIEVIESKNQISARNALSNLGGYLANRTNEIKNDLIAIYSKVIASIDFPEDVKAVDSEAVVTICSDKINEINEIIKNSQSYDFIKDGVSACLIGKPNVGKSSLFNCLLNYNRAIVTPIQGTTRDTIKETINLNGFLVNFVDTAGIRNKNEADLVEQIGIDNSIQSIENSQIVLFLYEKDKSEIEDELLELAKNKKTIFIKTKADLNNLQDDEAINISSVTGFGVDKLKTAILNIVSQIIPTDTDYFVNKRQLSCFLRCSESLNNVINSAKQDILNDNADLYAIDLKQAILALDEITGAVLTDNILDNIFDNFCIGK